MSEMKKSYGCQDLTNPPSNYNHVHGSHEAEASGRDQTERNHSSATREKDAQQEARVNKPPSAGDVDRQRGQQR